MGGAMFPSYEKVFVTSMMTESVRLRGQHAEFK